MNYQFAKVLLSRASMIMGQLIFAFLVVHFFIFDVARVNGRSMEPTYSDGSVFIVNKVTYLVGPPERFEIVQLIDPSNEEKLLIKRVIGMPGEVVVFQDEKVYLELSNGSLELIDESGYLPSSVKTEVGDGVLRMEVPENEYLVLGDNREFSAADSRGFGPVHRRLINGKASAALNGGGGVEASLFDLFATDSQ